MSTVAAPLPCHVSSHGPQSPLLETPPGVGAPWPSARTRCDGASSAALKGQAFTAANCMSKGALIQLTRSLAREFIQTPLRVNAIAPGPVETALVDGYHMPDVAGSAAHIARRRRNGCPRTRPAACASLAAARRLTLHAAWLMWLGDPHAGVSPRST
ncbi:SDR family oxidoreductase [Embleya sp. NPDC127516]|uniref:SDR family oxidoreductase n=1 Tax=Embleya sp. NPDC127516 TaxID=3363990 RepID=UPI0037F48D02